MMIGVEKGQSIIALMDDREIKAVVAEIRRLTRITHEMQESVWNECRELGYEDNMNPSEALGTLRFLFHGSRIGEKGGR
jgi:hypothetical protein